MITSLVVGAVEVDHAVMFHTKFVSIHKSPAVLPVRVSVKTYEFHPRMWSPSLALVNKTSPPGYAKRPVRDIPDHLNYVVIVVIHASSVCVLYHRIP